MFRNTLLFSVLFFLFSCAGTRKNKTADSKTEKQEIKKVVVDGARQRTAEKETNYTLQSFSITADTLSVEVMYTGGCGQHDFNLYSNGMLKKSLPPQLDVYLEHTAENDACKKQIIQVLKFDISPLKKPGNAKIIINLNAAENKAAWVISN